MKKVLASTHFCKVARSHKLRAISLIPEGNMYFVTRYLHKILRLPVKKFTVKGLEFLPDGGCLLASKHVENSDPYTLAAILPWYRPIHWLAHQNMFFIRSRFSDLYGYSDVFPMLKKYHLSAIRWALCWLRAVISVYAVRFSLTIPVDREKKDKKRNLQTIHHSRELLKKGDVIGIFPERAVRIKERFNIRDTRFTVLARVSEVPIFPVNIDLENRIIIFGRPIMPAEIVAMGVDADVMVMEIINNLR